MQPSSEKPIRIVIIDSHTLLRAGLRLIVEKKPDLVVVGEAGDAREGWDIVNGQKPDIVLLRLDPARFIGLDLIRKLITASSGSRIILLAQPDETKVAIAAGGEGVLGVVGITQTPQILIKAIKKVYAGEVWIERSMMASLLNSLSLARRSSALDPETEHISQLSERERQVIQLIGLGLKNKQIATQLSISEVTVRHHLTSVFSKLGVSDRLELLVFAHRSGLVTLKGLKQE
jgi:two-component system nitrate/nitrite response regulator NarL